MGEAIGDILPLAIGVAISPIPIIAVILILGTPRARANGPAFAIGWLVGLAIVGTIVLLLAGNDASEGSGEPATWASVLELVIGLAFLLAAVRMWRGRPREGRGAELPSWLRAVDRLTPGRSLGAGVLLSGLNPKNLVLTVAAANSVASIGLAGGEEAVALGVFVVLASLTIVVPVGLYVALGERARTMLEGWKTWMAAHNAAIMTVLLLLLAGKLIGDGVVGLSS